MSIYPTTPALSTSEAYETWLELGAELGFRPPAGIDPSMPSRVIAERLFSCCGRRKALRTRTALSQLAEAEDGRRQGGRGRDMVRRNGNGAAGSHLHIAAE